MNSVWNETASHDTRPALCGDKRADVLVIGGGMCGILTAHFLKAAGARPIVVEGARIGGGVTQNTTAKITAQHGLIYADLIARFGPEHALQYYSTNTEAIAAYHRLAEQFPCDFAYKTAHVYSTSHRDKLEREAKAYQTLHIPARLTEDLPLPLQTVGAVTMDGQAQFHPLKLLYALSEGLEIYENTFVQKLAGNTAHTARGKISAERIVLATHYPLVNILGLYFLKLYQHRSYVLALEDAPLVDGMFLDEQEAGLSFRTYGDKLLVGGGDHKTGKADGGLSVLRRFVKGAYPKAQIKHQWATQDCMSLDKVPYIGRHSSGSRELFLASGFNKWGMTGSMVAAQLLTDLIVQGKSAYESLYSPQRSILRKQLYFNLGAATVGLLTPGTPRCTHMGCKLHENTAEQSWDCACHGSRFTMDGQVITGPAKKELK